MIFIQCENLNQSINQSTDILSTQINREMIFIQCENLNQSINQSIDVIAP